MSFEVLVPVNMKITVFWAGHFVVQ